LPDSGSDSSEDEDTVGFGGLSAAGAHLGAGAALYLQTTKTLSMLFCILTIINVPLYLLYNNSTSNTIDDYMAIDRGFHFFGIGNLRGRSNYC
jgi:hypothetical protein